MTTPVRLKHVARIAVSNVDKKSVEGEPPVRLCNYTDVYYNERITEGLDFMNATASPDQVQDFRLSPGDVLITKDSETADDIAVPALVESAPDDLVCGYHLALIRPDPELIEPRFLFWSLAASTAREWFSTQATGVTRFGLRSQSIADARLRLPSIVDQRAIADFLDADTARIDALIEKKSRMIAVLEERSFALLSQVMIPPGCTLTRLGRFAAVQTGLTVDSSRPVGDDVVTRPYLRVANVLHGRLALDTVTEITVPRSLAERATLRPGDVLMTEGGDLDKLGRGTVWRNEIPGCLHQNHVFAVRTDPARLDGEYLALLTQTAHGRAYFERTGSRITNLASTSSTKVLDFPVPVLPLERQRALVDEASNATATIADISGRLTKQIDLLREHRQALITAAVTGELDAAKAAA